jgi:hypothetical protein
MKNKNSVEEKSLLSAEDRKMLMNKRFHATTVAPSSVPTTTNEGARGFI